MPLLDYLFSNQSYVQIYLEENGHCKNSPESSYTLLIWSLNIGMDFQDAFAFYDYLTSKSCSDFQFISYIHSKNHILYFCNFEFLTTPPSSTHGTSLSFSFTSTSNLPIELHKFLSTSPNFFEYTPTSKFKSLSKYFLNSLHQINYKSEICQTISEIIHASPTLLSALESHYELEVNNLQEILEKLLEIP